MAITVPVAIALVLFCAFVVFVPLLWFRWQGIREDTPTVTPETGFGVPTVTLVDKDADHEH